MEHLFPEAAVILCFLHGVLKIQTNATKWYDDYSKVILNKAWTAYRADNKHSFAQQIRRLKEWTVQYVPESNFKEAILKLCQKKRLPQIL